MSYTHCDMTNTRTYLTRTTVDRAAIRQHTWLILNMRHDSFLCVTWLVHTCVKRLFLTHISDTTHSRESSYKKHTWLITHRHDSFLCMTWLILVCDMTHSCAWHDAFICVKRLSLSRTHLTRPKVERAAIKQHACPSTSNPPTTLPTSCSRIMSHTRTSHATRIWVMPRMTHTHKWLTHINEPCQT